MASKKAQLVEAVRRELRGEVSKADASRIVTAVFKVIKTGVRKEKVVRLGRLEVVERRETIGTETPQEAGFQKRVKRSKALTSRSLKPAVQELTSNEKHLAEALSAVINATGVGGKEALRVMRTIGETMAIRPDAEDDAFERVQLRSLGADVELREAEGGGLSDSDFAARMGLNSRETIRQYREKGRLFAWPKDMRSFRYPAWQIHRGQLLPGLAEVLAVLKEKRLEPLSIIGYFLTPSDDLEDSRPLDLLRKGNVAEVVADAERYGDIGS
jgi:nucleoid DNA-binding protein